MRNSQIIAAVVIVVILIVAVAAYIYLVPGKPNSSTTGTSSGSSSSSAGGASMGSSTGTQTISTPTGTPIKIGIMGDETSLASITDAQIAAAQIAVNQVNTAGGVLGHPLQLVSVNEEPDPVAAAQTLVLQDNVSAVIGVSYSGDAAAIMPFLSQNKIIGIWCTDTLNSLMQNVSTDYNDYKYFFRLYNTNQNYAPGITTYFTSSNLTSVYFVGEDVSTTHEIATGLNSSLSAIGVKWLGATFFPFSQTDFSTIAAQIGSLHPAAVIDAQFSTSAAATFVQQLKANPQSSNIKVFLIGGGGLSDPNAIASVEKTNPGSLSGTYIEQFPGTNSTFYNSVNQQVAAAYQTATGQIYYPNIVHTYSAVEILAQAIQSAGSLNATKVVTALQNTHYDSPAGLVTFDSSHNWTFPGWWILQVQGNKLVVVYPTQFAKGKPIG